MNRRIVSALCLTFALSLHAADLTVTRYAGSDGGRGSYDGAGAAARFSDSAFLAAGPNGDLYVTSETVVRAITPDGVVRTVAGLNGASGNTDGRGAAARFVDPEGIAVDANGTMYVSDAASNRIRRISQDGVVTTLYVDDTVWSPQGIAVDGDGNVWVAAFDHTISRITPNGVRIIVAGTPGLAGFSDGPNSVARFYRPRGIAITPGGDLLITDSFNERVRKMTPSGDVSSLAMVKRSPGGIAVDASGNAYVVSTFAHVIEKVTPAGVVSTFSGSGTAGALDGSSTTSRFYAPLGVAVGADGFVYVSDFLNQTIRRIAADGSVTTIAGIAPRNVFSDGPLASAGFLAPRDMVFDSHGNAFVADNLVIRKITPAGIVSTFAGSGSLGYDDGTGTAASFWSLRQMAIDTNDNLYVTDASRIRKITPAAVVTTYAGGMNIYEDRDGNGTSAGFGYPYGIAVDAAGNVYVSDLVTNVIRKISPNRDVGTFIGIAGYGGFADGVGPAARFKEPAGLAIDASTGALLVSDRGNRAIRKVTLPGGVVTTIAGLQPSAAIPFDFTAPQSVTSLPNGTILVGDTRRIVELAGGVGTTVAGAGVRGDAPGTGPVVQFGEITGLTVRDGALYIADPQAQNIRIATPATLSDAAQASSTTPPVNTPVQLSTSDETATSWNWRIIRRPLHSNAELSATNVRTPTFTPDVSDLYTILLRAEGPSGVRYSMVDVQPSGCAPLAYAVATIAGGTEAMACLESDGGTATVSVGGG